MKWSEVTSQYSGLFFRAEGGESLPFGQTQSANQSTISDVHFTGCYYDSWSGNSHCSSQSTSLNREKWTNVTHDGYARSVWNLQFYKTSGEVRPKNTAIRIFKRIQ